MSDTVQALVLDDTVRVALEPVHFAGFPGLWITDCPVAVSELGFENEDVALAAVEELGLPLLLTSVPVGEGLMPEVANHVRAGEVPVSIDVDEAEVETVEEPAASDPFAEAVALSAAELIPSIQAADDLAWLATLEAEEKASKNRTSVLAAIEERRTAITPAPEPEPEETV